MTEEEEEEEEEEEGFRNETCRACFTYGFQYQPPYVVYLFPFEYMLSEFDVLFIAAVLINGEYPCVCL